ncbi:MAG: TonB-dependent receptor [Verrucomicrobia bacterium]|nr:TonB-dependent receptor [Verrucomicrobiota bacterium]
MEDVYEFYEDALTGANLDSLLNRRQELRPEVNGRFRDNISDGFELRLTANFTDNWRLSLNASKTDRIVSNSFSKAIDFLGLIKGEDGLLIQGFSEQEFPDPEEEGETIVGYVLTNPGAYVDGKVISEFIALGSQLPDGETISTVPGPEQSIATEIWEIVDVVNDRIEQDEKRWGLRPYRFNVFTTYDFKEGNLKGWSIGGGYRWSSANIVGEEEGREFEGEPVSSADFLLRYRTSRGGGFLGDGRWTFQLNVRNALNNRKIVPSRLAIDGNIDYVVPGGHSNGGPAYARFDLPTPRDYRLTVTYDF